jgi:hypothetical protein
VGAGGSVDAPCPGCPAAARRPTIAQTAPAPAAAPTALTLAEARGSTAGRWAGRLEYRDYQSGQWVGIPFTATVERLEDGVTLIRRSRFDDGPNKTVWITTVALLDPARSTETAASFRAGRETALATATLELTTAADATHWTMVERHDGEDDDRPAHLRETTVRDGDTITTLKEVDFADDAAVSWIARNRTTLKRLGD